MPRTSETIKSNALNCVCVFGFFCLGVWVFLGLGLFGVGLGFFEWGWWGGFFDFFCQSVITIKKRFTFIKKLEQ